MELPWIRIRIENKWILSTDCSKVTFIMATEKKLRMKLNITPVSTFLAKWYKAMIWERPGKLSWFIDIWRLGQGNIFLYLLDMWIDFRVNNYEEKFC